MMSAIDGGNGPSELYIRLKTVSSYVVLVFWFTSFPTGIKVVVTTTVNKAKDLGICELNKRKSVANRALFGRVPEIAC